MRCYFDPSRQRENESSREKAARISYAFYSNRLNLCNISAMGCNHFSVACGERRHSDENVSRRANAENVSILFIFRFSPTPIIGNFFLVGRARVSCEDE